MSFQCGRASRPGNRFVAQAPAYARNIHASATVPAGALAADTELTVAVEAASGDAQTNIYDFGPDGTTFQAAVTIAITFDGAVPEGKKAALAWWDGSAWEEIPGSALADGKVAGHVSHFSRFTVVIVDGALVVQGNCDGVDTDFTPCGGELAGTWVFQDMCLATDVNLGQIEFADQCPEAYMTFDLEFVGSVTFSADSFTRNITSTSFTRNTYVPVTCLQDIFTMDCAGWAEQAGDDGVACEDVEGVCTCSRTDLDETGNDETVPYTIEGGNTIVFLDEEGGESRLPFCQSGTDVVVENADFFGEGTGNVYMLLRRQ